MNSPQMGVSGQKYVITFRVFTINYWASLTSNLKVHSSNSMKQPFTVGVHYILCLLLFGDINWSMNVTCVTHSLPLAVLVCSEFVLQSSNKNI